MSSEEVPTGYLLKRAQAALRHAMDTALAEEGLSMAQYAALAALTRDVDLTNAELARSCFVTPQTMIRIVTTLDDCGWIERRTDPSNARRILNTITTTGRKRIAGADDVADVVGRRMVAGFSKTEEAKFRSYLHHCLRNLEANAPNVSL